MGATETVIHQRFGLLQDAVDIDQSRAQTVFACGKVMQPALGLRAPLAINGNLNFVGSQRPESLPCSLRNKRPALNRPLFLNEILLSRS